MPRIRPISAVEYAQNAGTDISSLIAPPYDVLDEASKAALLSRSEHNIVAVDLPYLPPKTVGPDHVYAQAGERYRDWLDKGILARRSKPALYAYQQQYEVNGRSFARRGLMANVQTQPFGQKGGVHPHEQTFASAKEDRLKLMAATKAQLSPIFGLYTDSGNSVQTLLDQAITAGSPTRFGTTDGDGVVHQMWAIDDDGQIQAFVDALADTDIFIADGHHRYTTALNYMQQQGSLPEDHPATDCLFVLVSMQDPGMVILPTHRVLGGMPDFDFDRFVELSRGLLNITPVAGDDLEALAAQLPSRGPHAMGLYHPANADQPLAIATTVSDDPLASSHPQQSAPWRMLDVAIVQHLLVEQICQPLFCPADTQITWKFPHTLGQARSITESDGFQLGVIMQPTPLESVGQISEAGELMPQKSTFFYPKLATGLVMNSLE